MNWRSCLTGIATGDQCIFVRRDLFNQLHGFPNIPLMEDIALCKKLKHHGRPACLKQTVITSSRRWEQKGIIDVKWNRVIENKRQKRRRVFSDKDVDHIETLHIKKKDIARMLGISRQHLNRMEKDPRLKRLNPIQLKEYFLNKLKK